MTLITASQGVTATTATDADGRFRFADVSAGTYEVLVDKEGFDEVRVAVRVGESNRAAESLRLVLGVRGLAEQVTISAETGRAIDKDETAQAVNVIGEERIRERANSVLAQVADEEAGIALQRTSPTIGAIYVRGLTGKNVATYVDGVRFTTSAQRGGINTFFNLNEPTNLRAVEVLRGPNSAQYGSDALGGSVQLFTRVPPFGTDRAEFHGEVNTFATSADASFGGNTLLSYGTNRFGILTNLASRRVNTLRSANGIDTHAAVTRFLGLPSNIFGTRLSDTAFTQYGGSLRVDFTPATDNQLVFQYQRSQQDGGKRYDQTLGGDGNLIADLRNLMLDFGYVRYLRQNLGIFDSGSFTASYNAQREERVNQGGQGDPRAQIVSQYERTRALGFNFYVTKQIGSRNALVIGGDVYRERIRAPASTFSFTTNTATPSRPRVPDNSRYTSGGIYVQDTFDAIPDRLKLTGALRLSGASYRARAADNLSLTGTPLLPDDSFRTGDFSGRFGAVTRISENANFIVNYSRGFRTPSVTDLGTLGLTGDGFEVAAPDIANLNAFIGTTAGDTATSSGLPVSQLRSETSDNIDFGFNYRRRRFDTDATFFYINLGDTITKQALILPFGAVGTMLGGERIERQLPNGVVFVPASASPVLVRANFTSARLFGLEYTVDARLTRTLTFGGNFTYIRAEDTDTGAPPNIEGGTPAPRGFVRLRFDAPSRRYYVEAYSTLVSQQSRLSSLDLSDRRTGAPRSRNQIAAFFRNGARARGLTGTGANGQFDSPTTGVQDDVLLATGETLAQVQTRVLGALTPNSVSVPLFTRLPGYGLFNVRGGLRLSDAFHLDIEFENITDQTHRGVSWGIDGAGRSVTVRSRYRF